MTARQYVAAWRFPLGIAVTHVDGWTGVVALAPHPNPATVPAVYVEHARYGCWYAPHVLTPIKGAQPEPTPLPEPLPVPPVIARTRGKRGGRQH